MPVFCWFMDAIGKKNVKIIWFTIQKQIIVNAKAGWFTIGIPKIVIAFRLIIRTIFLSCLKFNTIVGKMWWPIMNIM